MLALHKAGDNHQRDNADEQPEQNALKERPPANGAERFCREGCSDQKESERQTRWGHLSKDRGDACHSRHETASHRGEQEKPNKPRDLHFGPCPGLAVNLARSKDGCSGEADRVASDQAFAPTLLA
jgi:hypothetical protein